MRNRRKALLGVFVLAVFVIMICSAVCVYLLYSGKRTEINSISDSEPSISESMPESESASGSESESEPEFEAESASEPTSASESASEPGDDISESGDSEAETEISGGASDESDQPETVTVTEDDLLISLTEYAPMNGDIVSEYSDEGEYLTEFEIMPVSDAVHDLKIVSLAFDEDGICRVEDVLKEIGPVSEGDILSVKFALGDFDSRGVVYTDEEGNAHAFSINTSGYDGSVYTATVDTD